MNKFEVVEDYLINPRTIILLPARHIEYETIIIEQNKQFLVRKTALELMENACSRYGSKFDGRRKSVMEKTGFKRRVPIPVSIHFDIYAFPTHAIKDYDCIWIFANHVQYVGQIREQGAKEISLVVFNNGLQYKLDVSQYTLKTQLDRAKMCRYVFTDGIEKKFM